MDHKWLDDAFDAFQQENGGLDYESLMEMMLAIEYWAEEHKQGLTEARRSAKIRKNLFDAAKELVTDGFTPCQVALILHEGIGSTCKPPSVCEGFTCEERAEEASPFLVDLLLTTAAPAIKAGKLTKEELQAAAEAVGVSLPFLANRPDLVPRVKASLEALIASR